MRLNYLPILIGLLFSFQISHGQNDSNEKAKNIKLSTYYGYIQGTIDSANTELIKNDWKITSAVLDLKGTTADVDGKGIKFLIFDFSKSKKSVKSTNVVLTIAAPIVKSSNLSDDSNKIKDSVQEIVNYLVNNCLAVENQYKELDSYPKSLALTVLHGVEKKGKNKIAFKLFDELVSVNGELGIENNYVQKITFTAERVTPAIFVKDDE